jgi:hypothetical protein
LDVSDKLSLFSEDAKREKTVVQARKAYRGSRGIASLNLNLGGTWRSFVNFTSRPIYPRKRTPATIE